MNKIINIKFNGMTLRLVLILMLLLVSLFSLRAQVLERDSYFSGSNPRNTVVVVKTNLLFDLATALNVEVEVPIANRFSIAAEDLFPWWNIGNKYCLQMWEMGAEARFWFKAWEKKSTQKLRGWFVGAYGMSAKYDLQYNTSFNYQGEFWSAGLTGGYAIPLGKKKNMSMEFSISLGFLQTDYRHYLPTDDYIKLIRDPYNVGVVSYFGPTKARVSLVIPINFGKKGENKKEVNNG